MHILGGLRQARVFFRTILVKNVVKLGKDLDFLGKKAIIQKVVDKVVATKERATITGRIPIYASANDAEMLSNEVVLNAKNRNDEITNQSFTPYIPFKLKVILPRITKKTVRL